MAKIYDSKSKRQTFLFCQHKCKFCLFFQRNYGEMEHFSRYTNTHFWNQGEPVVIGIHLTPSLENNLPDRKCIPEIYPSRKYPLGNYPQQKIPLSKNPPWKISSLGKYPLMEDTSSLKLYATLENLLLHPSIPPKVSLK